MPASDASFLNVRGLAGPWERTSASDEHRFALACRRWRELSGGRPSPCADLPGIICALVGDWLLPRCHPSTFVRRLMDSLSFAGRASSVRCFLTWACSADCEGYSGSCLSLTTDLTRPKSLERRICPRLQTAYKMTISQPEDRSRQLTPPRLLPSDACLPHTHNRPPANSFAAPRVTGLPGTPVRPKYTTDPAMASGLLLPLLR